MAADGRSPFEHERPRSRPWRRLVPSPGMAVAMLGLCVAVGGVAVAAIPGPGGVVKTCYRDAPGQRPLSVVDTDAECPNGFVLLPLNQQGPDGPQGATGPQGPGGPQGPAGVTTLYSTAPIAAQDKVISLAKDKVTKIATLTLPAGAYLLTAKASVHLDDIDNDTWKNLDNEYPLDAGAFGNCELLIFGPPGPPTLADKADLSIHRSVRFSLGLGGDPILGKDVHHRVSSETTMSLVHAADVGAGSKVELRCTNTDGGGRIELSHVKLVALPATNLAVGPQPTLSLKKPESGTTVLTKKKPGVKKPG